LSHDACIREDGTPGRRAIGGKAGAVAWISLPPPDVRKLTRRRGARHVNSVRFNPISH
jgi:hypothetical protein